MHVYMYMYISFFLVGRQGLLRAAPAGEKRRPFSMASLVIAKRDANVSKNTHTTHTHTTHTPPTQAPIYVFALDASPTGVESGMLQAALEAIRAHVASLPGGEKGKGWGWKT